MKDQMFIYTTLRRGVTPKRVTSSGAHLRGLAPGEHCFKKRLRDSEPFATLCPISPTWDSVARGFATWKIRHMEDSPQKIRHKDSTGETYECDREFERKRRTNVCNSADVEDSPHNGDRLGSRGGVGSGGLGLGGLRSRGLGRGVRVGGLGSGRVGNSQPLTPPTPNPPTTTPLTYHRCVADFPHRHCCKRLSDAYAQILGHIRYVANLLCGESSVVNPPAPITMG